MMLEIVVYRLHICLFNDWFQKSIKAINVIHFDFSIANNHISTAIGLLGFGVSIAYVNKKNA